MRLAEYEKVMRITEKIRNSETEIRGTVATKINPDDPRGNKVARSVTIIGAHGSVTINGDSEIETLSSFLSDLLQESA